MPTVQETFEAMASRFRPERAQGVRAVVQYHITGEGGGSYYAEIADGSCTIHQGSAPSPTTTITISAPDWLDLVAGKLQGQLAFMQGRLKVTGDMGLAMRLAGMFGL
ncbi:MAG: SCP2 sterol-binding domain-containing protein [Armatimonadota bacterium]|nr:SCP2 sterol-binding domain-containing protein [Armatimonadota bacterium]